MPHPAPQVASQEQENLFRHRPGIPFPEGQNPIRFIRESASRSRPFSCVRAIRTYPSPLRPNPLPGVVTIPALVSRWVQKEAEPYPFGTGIQT